HSPEMEIMKQMLKAEKRVDFAIFTFSKSSGIDDTMIALCKSNKKVKGILEAKQANQTWSAKHPLKENGVEVYTAEKKGNMRKLHHKLMVIDEQVVIGGSFNYTGPANQLNDENIIIFGALGKNGQATKGKQRDFAKYALDEIKRIINVYGKPV
ncbi:phospholipase D-like domain-containing protein, partial [candidate division KSB1 bacterium]